MTDVANPGLELSDDRADHFLGLPGAQIVATKTLMAVRDNLAEVLTAKAMMCVHGDAGLGKTFSVNASLRELAPETVCRVQFRARPTPRDIRHVLFSALGIGGPPPAKPIEFDAMLKSVLSQRFRVLVCDEAQWLSRECFEYWRICGTTGRPTSRSCSSAAGTATRCCGASRCCPRGSMCSRSSGGCRASRFSR